jgi:hypothetical protein
MYFKRLFGNLKCLIHHTCSADNSVFSESLRSPSPSYMSVGEFNQKTIEALASCKVIPNRQIAFLEELHVTSIFQEGLPGDMCSFEFLKIFIFERFRFLLLDLPE